MKYFKERRTSVGRIILHFTIGMLKITASVPVADYKLTIYI
jgi:hypothetical protein